MNDKRKLTGGVESLDHFFVCSSDLELTKHFYCEVLGLENGPRPSFSFPGYWFYLNGQPVVHAGTSEFSGGFDDLRKKTRNDTGTLDHIAFRCNNISEFISHFENLGQNYKTKSIPDFNLKQIFVKDPNGVIIELNFFEESE